MFKEFEDEKSRHVVPQQAGGERLWNSYVVDQRWNSFTQEDHRVWDTLYARQVRALECRIIDPFLDGLDMLDLGRSGIPELRELNARLEPRTGWRAVAVPGLVPDEAFFAMLAERLFPVGNFIRSFEQLDYLEEPDCFHDIFGHVPLLADPSMAAMMQHVGRLGLQALAAGHGEWLARIYWHTVEFGLALEGGETKILGAGLASSFGESRFSLESDAVARPRFTIGAAMRTAYRHDAFQPLYFVADSLEAVAESIGALDLEQLQRLGARNELATPR